jgi:tetratricopeptide (TPR) repeat protein
MADGRPRREAWLSRLAILAAATLAGLGVGAGGAAAASPSLYVRAFWAAVGAMATLYVGWWYETFKDRRAKRAIAIEERSNVLEPLFIESDLDDSVLGMLDPRRYDAPQFVGRTEELKFLAAWCDNFGRHLVAAVTGPGGSGKTRLAIEFAARRPRPWVTGWLRRGYGDRAVAAMQACGDPALILVDDANVHSDLRALLENLDRSHDGSPVKVLLITRSAGWPAQMAASLRAPHQRILAAENIRLCPVGPFGTTSDHARWFGKAVEAYARMGVVKVPPDGLTSLSLDYPESAAEPILTLHAQALLTVLDTADGQASSEMRALPFSQVAKALLLREQQRWNDLAEAPAYGLPYFAGEVQQRVVAALILAAAASEADGIAALRWVPDLATTTDTERLHRIFRWASQLYPSTPPGPLRMRPTMFAEWFLVTNLADEDLGLFGRISNLTPTRVGELLTILASASDHTPLALTMFSDVLTADLTGLVAAGLVAALSAWNARVVLDTTLATLIAGTDWPHGKPRELGHLIPAGALPRTEVALSAASVSQTRGGADRELATALLVHAGTLNRLGRYREALSAAEESASFYEKLETSDLTLTANLAAAAQSRGDSLLNLGNRWEALAAFNEATALCMDPTTDNPGSQAGLAAAARGRSDTLRHMGCYQQALAAADQAITHCRALIVTDAYAGWREPLVLALESRCAVLIKLRRAHRALADADEAKRLSKTVVTGSTAPVAGFAAAMVVRAEILRHLDRCQEALAPAGAAVGLYRELSALSPVHLSGLAQALREHAAILTALGYRKAFAASAHAVALCRRLPEDNPIYQLGLAHAIQSHSHFFGRILAGYDEAIGICRGLPGDNPADQYELAIAIQNRSTAVLSRSTDGLAGLDEAIAICRQLPAVNPVFRNALAIMLRNRSVTLKELGRHVAAEADTQEALKISVSLPSDWHTSAAATLARRLYAVLSENQPARCMAVYEDIVEGIQKTLEARISSYGGAVL